jgi:lipopolysaccharide biosynthesis protein
MRAMKRLCVFAHYDCEDRVDDYVLYYLESLREIADRLIVVSTAGLGEVEIKRLSGRCDEVILRENRGYDFGSWQRGLESAGMAGFDEVILCNDSVYGPFSPLTDVFSKMALRDCDFWGITENHEISNHLQSYFLVFRKNVVDSPDFADFWQRVTRLESKQNIIQEYEIGLSQLLMTSGFTAMAYVQYHPLRCRIIAERIRQKRQNKQRINPGRLLKELLKAKVSFFNPLHFFWKEIIRIDDYKQTIQRNSDYPVELIERHLERMGKRSN